MRIPSFSTAVFFCCVVVLCRTPARAQCVGDCAGDGEVTINDLILGVNIALGSAPVSACQSFANAEGEVTISRLILGVNNALNGCPPPVATATATAIDTAVAATTTATATSTAPPSATGTATRTATAPRTATVTRSATATRTGTATRTDTAAATATATPTPTATGPTPTSTSPVPCGENDDCAVGQVCVEHFCVASTPTATATTSAGTPTVTSTGAATATQTATAPSTATATNPPSTTATQAASATATNSAVRTSTTTALPTSTSSSTATATRTSSASATPTDTATRTPTSTPTHTPTVTPTSTPTIPPSSTPLPPGQAVGAAFVSSGLSGIQALVGAVAAILKNNSEAALLAQSSGVGGIGGLPPGQVACPINGSTSQDCTKDPDTTVHLTLAADQCVAAGPAGGRAEFNGSIALDSTAFILNSCDPVRFLSAAFATDGLSVQFSDAQSTPLYGVTADLTGTAGIASLDANCLVGGLNLTLNGLVTLSLANGQSVSVTFADTLVAISAITYNADCVPLAYTLTFNGDASFTPMLGAPLAALSGVIAEDTFAVTFSDFVLEQDATDLPVTVQMMGGITSDCYGGLVSLETFTPIALGAGLCPNAGQLDVTGSGMSMATVVYDDGKVLVTPAGGQQTTYLSCFAPELLMCQPQ